MRVKGFTRAGPAVVNTDSTKLDLIKEKRAQKKGQDRLAGEIGQLRNLVLELKQRVEELERGRAT